MKNKIIYLFILLFSINLLSAAGNNKCICPKDANCKSSKQEDCIDTDKAGSGKISNYDFSNPSLFLLNI